MINSNSTKLEPHKKTKDKLNFSVLSVKRKICLDCSKKHEAYFRGLPKMSWGGGVSWYFLWYGDVPSRNYRYHFHNFQTFNVIMGTLSRIFYDVRNYGLDVHSNSGILGLTVFRIYRIIGTNLSGKMARPRQMTGRDTPPPPGAKNR